LHITYNVSPVNAKLTSPSYVYQYIYFFLRRRNPCHSNTNSEVCFPFIRPVNRPPAR